MEAVWVSTFFKKKFILSFIHGEEANLKSLGKIKGMATLWLVCQHKH